MDKYPVSFTCPDCGRDCVIEWAWRDTYEGWQMRFWRWVQNCECGWPYPSTFRHQAIEATREVAHITRMLEG